MDEWRSFEKVFEYVRSGGTLYERDHGIKCVSTQELFSSPHFRIFSFLKSDNSLTLVCFYSEGLTGEKWFFLVPTMSQIEGLRLIPELFSRIEVYNGSAKKVFKGLASGDEKC